MIKRCISADWKFRTTGDYISIDLPHDYAIGSERSAHGNGVARNGFFSDERGFYVKHLTFDEEKHYILDIDGAYMGAQIFLNENHLAHHPYGYTPFLVDLSSHVNVGRINKLMIITNPLPCTTRWYTGNGIYRDVFLWEGGEVRIEPWDMFIYTVEANEQSAKLRLKFTVKSDVTADIKVCFEVLYNDDTVKTEEMCLNVHANEDLQNEYMIDIENPCLWDMENPNMYTLKTTIYKDGILTDTAFNEFGIRTVYADAQKGLLLNGKPIKLRGGCIHHDHGVLGAAAFPAAEERKIRLLKEAGFNSVRIAHNPPSLALLECCDRMGIIVMDEAFDCWNKGKSANDYHLFFEDWYARDISYMVRRDRNHPCVFSYSIGNEIGEIDGTSDAAGWSKRLVEEVKKHDDTKFVTSAIQKIFARRVSETIDPDDYKEYMKEKYTLPTMENINRVTASYEAPLDIVGNNYYFEYYMLDHEWYPDRVMWGSETKALEFYDSWRLTKENAFIIGDYTWTAIDNMGEVGAGRSLWARDGIVDGLTSLGEYPWRTCYQGDLDLCGYRRPQSYFREAVWLGNTEPRIFVTHPEHFGEGFTGTGWHWYDVNETWTFDDKYIGQPVRVETYTDADEIVWYVNDKKIGTSKPEKAIAYIHTTYEKGSITAVAYKQGKECSRYTLYTTGVASAIQCVAESQEFLADNRDLCYFDISITDANGHLVVEAENEITCIVKGGELLGVFSGNPCNEDQYTSNKCHTFKGRALAVVRTRRPGDVGINVYSDELASGYAQSKAILQ